MTAVTYTWVMRACAATAAILCLAAPAAMAETNVLNGLSESAKEAVPPAAPAGPVVEAARARLTDKSFVGKAHGDDVSAVRTYYREHGDALWIKDGAYTANANAVIAEFKKAEDWGLEPAPFEVPTPAPGAAPEALGEADAKLTLAALKYVRYARGGRVDPLSLSNILDMKPPLKDPPDVMRELSNSSAPATYLTEQHPKHDGFEKLRQALLKARGPVEAEQQPIDEALKIKLPVEGKTLKLGSQHDDVAMLRKRLKVEIAVNADERTFDDKLVTALKAYQESKGLKANGQLNNRTRSALNRDGEPKKAESKSDAINRLIVNMERWRWLPENPGDFYVINNIPEYMSRVVKNGNEVFKTKLVVGQPAWPTPVLAAKMEAVVFHPEWGMPDGIKVKELLPKLRRASASSGGGFFEELFSGKSNSGGGRVLQAYKLNPTLNGQPVDADRINWNSVDIRQFSFVQPAGATNPLGEVKFRFPNRHDVYMHDTPQKSLFAQSERPFSHGCMRVEDPRRLAEVILDEDKGWSKDKVGAQFGGRTNDVALGKPVPVYLTYFTARVDEDGKLVRYSDIYAHDERLMSALQGRVVRYSAPEQGVADDVTASVASSYDPPEAVTGKKGKNQATGKYKKPPQTVGDLLLDALTNF